mmetsp:Transcript_49033/g.73162  ORF Transcript_49033/g.73162 Transcript_49033/m.73162 type:complete len:434 (-) Transcript_49033:111-1412(-)
MMASWMPQAVIFPLLLLLPRSCCTTRTPPLAAVAPNDTYSWSVWELPPSCTRPLQVETDRFTIYLHFVSNGTTNTSFPDDLKAPVRAAADWWSRAIVNMGSSTTAKENSRGRNKNKKAQKRQKERVLQSACGGVPYSDGSGHGSENNNDTATTTIKHAVGNNSILICVHYDEIRHLVGREDSLGYGVPLVQTKSGRPVVSKIGLNREFGGQLDHCDWANIAAHEIAHALGFLPKRLVRGSHLWQSRSVGGGTQTQREWQELTNAAAASQHGKDAGIPLRPPLVSDGSSHWSTHCFEQELMQPEYDRDVQTCSRNPLSRLTLATMQDMGYIVNYGCADDNAHFRLLDTCTREHHPTRAQLALKQARRKVKRSMRKMRIYRRKLKRYPRKLKRYLQRKLLDLVERLPGVEVYDFNPSDYRYYRRRNKNRRRGNRL